MELTYPSMVIFWIIYDFMLYLNLIHNEKHLQSRQNFQDLNKMHNKALK
jgi:hypothetical protein